MVYPDLQRALRIRSPREYGISIYIYVHIIFGSDGAQACSFEAWSQRWLSTSSASCTCWRCKFSRRSYFCVNKVDADDGV